MRQGLTTFGELTGGMLFAYGCWSYSEPAGFLAGGVLLAAFSWLAAR